MATSWTAGLGGGNPIRYVFVTELRTAINALRAANGLPAYSWTNPGLAAGDPIRAIYFSELRLALNDVFVAKSSLCPMFTKGLPLPSTPIRAQHLLDLQKWVNKLEDGIDPRFGAVFSFSQTQVNLFNNLNGFCGLNWNYVYDWPDYESKAGIGTFCEVGHRFGNNALYRYSTTGRGSTRFMDTDDSKGVTRYQDPDYLNEFPDGVWFRASTEPDNNQLGGPNDNVTDYNLEGVEQTPPGWRGRGQFPTWTTVGLNYDGTQPGVRIGESFAIQPERYAAWFYKYWNLIRPVKPNSRVGFAGLTDAGRRNKSWYRDGDIAKPADWAYDDTKKYEWLDAALAQLNTLFGQPAHQVLNPDNFFWALHFYPSELVWNPTKQKYEHVQSNIDNWMQEIRNTISHVRGLGYSSEIPTLITEFGSLERKETDDVDRVQGMEMMVNGLKSIEASYRVVAWFWFPGLYVSAFPYSSLIRQPPNDNQRTTLGDKYKQLAGA